MTREEQRDMACTNWICSQENGTVIKARNVWKAAVEWADSHPQWIPVEEELPKENEEVLAYNAENEEVIACDYRHKMFHCWPEAFKESITHWMPKPMPPTPRKEV